MKTMRVLIFGATGTGKTSLCNLLTGGKRPADSGAHGVTTKTHLYPPFYEDDWRIEVVDTAGLHESEHGTVPAEKAILQIVELLKSAREGFSLLVHVARAGRLTQQHDEDYDFFVEKMAQENIPSILVLTGCENFRPMSAWVESNKSAFRRFRYKRMVATCLAEGGELEAHYAPLRAESREQVVKAFLACTLPEPVPIYDAESANGFSQALTRLWNEFVVLAGLPDKYRRRLNESAYALMKRIGVPKKVRDAAVKHVPELAREIGRKIPIPYADKVLEALARLGVDRIFRRIPGD